MNDEPQSVTLNIVRMTCETCGFPIDARQFPGLAWEILPHYYCDTPLLSLIIHHVKKLGTVRPLR